MIGVEGARSLSEAFKINTTLTALNLAGVQQDNAKRVQKNKNNIKKVAAQVMKERVN